MQISKYIPSNDSAFCDLVNTVIVYSDAHCAGWGVMPPGDEMTLKLNDLKMKVERCKLPTRSPVDTISKNNARRILEKEFRNYVQGFLARNVRVTDEDRRIMGLPIYDKKPTPIGPPQGQAMADVSYLGGQLLQLHIKHLNNTPYDKKANYGVKIYYGVYADDNMPKTGDDLPKSKFTKRKKETIQFTANDVRKTAYFCLQYENSKGIAGPWGPMFWAVIP